MRSASVAIIGFGLALGTAVPARSATSQTETMVHWSCDRRARVTVAVTWRSTSTARVRWTVQDRANDGRAPTVMIYGLDHRGAKPADRRKFFTDWVVATGGAGAERSGEREWRPGLQQLDEIEVFIRNRGATCGTNTIKRLNDLLHSPQRSDPLGYADSKQVRDRIVAEAYRQLSGVNRERFDNCSKYVNAFYEPNICQPWCADFAWWLWTAAGVPGARAHNSGYTNDFRDEWRVTFKPLGGRWKPAKGDVMVQEHRTTGVNGHVGVVVAVDGWKVKLVHGNWGDRVNAQGWTDPFRYRSDGGAKRVIGFASPA